nr:immunoglobulin light chain junction region [Macaca mulatta]MOX82080.1 immunoglobulin light chain junction region [Macaca mulatta]
DYFCAMWHSSASALF